MATLKELWAQRDIPLWLVIWRILLVIPLLTARLLYCSVVLLGWGWDAAKWAWRVS